MTVTTTRSGGGCRMINEERFFRHIAPYVGDSEQLVEEAIENAVRAHATRIDVDFKVDEETGCAVLTMRNDGEVLEDFSKLFVVAESGYDEKVMREHKPAGMGILMMLAAANEALFRSGEKEVFVDTVSFFCDPEYRAGLLDSIRPAAEQTEGMLVRLFGKKERLETAVNHIQREKHRYPIKIYLNGEEVKPVLFPAVGEKMGDGILEGCRILYLGLDVYQRGYSYPSSYGGVYWHGKRMALSGIAELESIFVIEVVGANGFIKPRLPDRTQCLNTSEEIEALNRACRDLFADEIRKDFLNLAEKAKGGSRGASRVLESAIEHGHVPPSGVLNDLPEWQGLRRTDVEEGKILLVPAGSPDIFEMRVDGETEWREEEYYGDMDIPGIREFPPPLPHNPDWFDFIEEPERYEIVAQTTKRLKKASEASQEYDIRVVESFVVNGCEVKEGAVYDSGENQLIIARASVYTHQPFLARCYASVFDESTTYDEAEYGISKDIARILEAEKGGAPHLRMALEDIARSVAILYDGLPDGSDEIERIEIHRDGEKPYLLVNGRYKLPL